MRRRVAVTGLGAITPYGEGARRYWDNLKAGRSAIRAIRLFDPALVSSRVAAEVHDWDPGRIVEAKDIKRLPRVAIMAIGSAREALEHAGIDPSLLPTAALRRIGVILGSSSGGIEFAEQQYRLYFSGEQDARCYPFAVSSAFVGMLSSEVSIAFGLRGPSQVLSTGCTSSTDAMGHAFRSIQYGTSDVVVTGGADCCITQGIVDCYGRMKCVSTHYNDTPERASRPFNRDRDGFVIGEGSWTVVLEEYEHAIRRGARILAEVAGYGATCDAFHRVQIMPTGEESARAMTLALEDAGVPPDHVQYINLHGTSTFLNDKTETAAIKLAFGKYAHEVMASATKSLIGHPQGAAGAAGVVATLLAMEESFLHPTINYESPDPDCDLDYIPNRGRTRAVDFAMCNTIAFGSKNSALLLKRPDARVVA
ncbi:MAG TPA: beta-ketoacyl-[acyl-carrier-protein] synthase family protein [Planctomycetota bacterium]|nr:beta-ketoacyl-[acyl-carrier-protein] synthase family protein [Planctomycetota bacterium]